MDPLLIPQPDTIPVHWGWFQFLLLLTFPLHLLAMNAMLGGLLIGVLQHIQGGDVRKQLAHRIAVALPLVIAFVVNFGVAPLLFLQVLYGQFIYTSSVLMGTWWILIVPVLIMAYYGAYLYDFKFRSLAGFGPVIGLAVFVVMLVIGFFFSNNMLLMSMPERFGEYFSHRGGDVLSTGAGEFWPRYLHMILGSLAIGGLFVGLLGKFKRVDNEILAEHAEKVGLGFFTFFTCINVAAGFWYLLSLPEGKMSLFMGGNLALTVVFAVGLLLTLGALYAGFVKKFWLAFSHGVALVFVMVFMRSWLRSSYLEQVFTLDQLMVAPQYSPFVFFVAVFVVGLLCLWWLLKQTAEAV